MALSRAWGGHRDPELARAARARGLRGARDGDGCRWHGVREPVTVDQPTADTDDGGEGGQTDTDGEEDPCAGHACAPDPSRSTAVRPTATRAMAEVIEPGVWCKTIAVFWGGTVPDGVRFTFETAVTDRPGSQVEGGVCGSRGADRCLPGHDASRRTTPSIFCSLIVLRPGREFEDGTTHHASRERSSVRQPRCAMRRGARGRPGPPIVVTPTPGNDEQNQDQDQEQIRTRRTRTRRIRTSRIRSSRIRTSRIRTAGPGPAGSGRDG